MDRTSARAVITRALPAVIVRRDVAAQAPVWMKAAQAIGWFG